MPPAIWFINPPVPSTRFLNRDYMGGYGVASPGRTHVLPPVSLVQLAGTAPIAQRRLWDAAASGNSAAEVVAAVSAARPAVCVINTATASLAADAALGATLARLGVRVVFAGPQAAHEGAALAERTGAAGVLHGFDGDTGARLLGLADGAQPPDLAPAGLDARMRTGSLAGDPDLLPRGAWAEAPLDQYRFSAREPRPFVALRTAWGCVYGCRFCPYVQAEGRRVRAMSPARVVDEISWLARDHGVRFILLRDALLTLDRPRIEELCRLLERARLGVRWRGETSTQHLDDDLIGRMQAAGCTGLNLGVEGVDPATAGEMAYAAKRRDLDQVRRVFATARRVGLRTLALFVVGLPSDTRASLAASVAFARRLRPAFAQFLYATPYPGTDLYALARHEGLLEVTDLSCFDGMTPLLRTRALGRREVALWGRLATIAANARADSLAEALRTPATLLERARAAGRYLAGHGREAA